mmetsp:Transcript_101766/g.202072  ORF Transcript_101766/g.202072 Transcript_101766/m.202072 type:complete len:251 (+) Transcript_101766:275-1027(+)
MCSQTLGSQRSTCRPGTLFRGMGICASVLGEGTGNPAPFFLTRCGNAVAVSTSESPLESTAGRSGERNPFDIVPIGAASLAGDPREAGFARMLPWVRRSCTSIKPQAPTTATATTPNIKPAIVSHEVVSPICLVPVELSPPSDLPVNVLATRVPTEALVLKRATGSQTGFGSSLPGMALTSPVAVGACSVRWWPTCTSTWRTEVHSCPSSCRHSHVGQFLFPLATTSADAACVLKAAATSTNSHGRAWHI